MQYLIPLLIVLFFNGCLFDANQTLTQKEPMQIKQDGVMYKGLWKNQSISPNEISTVTFPNKIFEGHVRGTIGSKFRSLYSTQAVITYTTDNQMIIEGDSFVIPKGSVYKGQVGNHFQPRGKGVLTTPNFVAKGHWPNKVEIIKE